MEESEDLLSCDICREIFNGTNRIPRMLPCGHSFCSTCLSTIILQAKEPKCPLCLKFIQYKFVYEIPCNFSLKQVAENYQGNNETSSSSSITSTSFDDSKCSVHKLPQTHYCEDCRKFLCSKCISNDHKVSSSCSHEPMEITEVFKVKMSQCHVTSADLNKRRFIQQRKLKKLSNHVSIDLQMYLNLAEEQEKELKITQDLIHSLNADLTKIANLEDEMNSLHIHELQQSNLDATSFDTIFKQETELRKTLDHMNQFQLSVEQCEVAILADLQHCTTTMKDTIEPTKNQFVSFASSIYDWSTHYLFYF